jgi:hypothetical protein
MLWLALILAAQSEVPAPTPVVADTAVDVVDDAAPASSPAPAAARQRVLVLDLQGVGVTAEDARLITGAVAALVGENAQLDVVTGADMRQLAEVAATKQSIGCDDAGCLAELAGALDATFIISGDVGRLGTAWLVNLSLFDATRAKSAGRVSAEVASLEVMPQSLRPTVNTLLQPFGGIAVADAGPSTLAVAGGVTAGVGALATVAFAGAAFAFDGVANDPREAFSTKNDALTAGLACLVGAGVSGLATVAGAGLLILGLTE